MTVNNDKNCTDIFLGIFMKSFWLDQDIQTNGNGYQASRSSSEERSNWKGILTCREIDRYEFDAKMSNFIGYPKQKF